jgi:outer membrane protein assembly factor BamB
MTQDPVAADAAPRAAHRPRLWLPVALLTFYWAFIGITYLVEMPTFTRFLAHTGAFLFVALVFLLWWAFNRRVRARDRIIILATAVASPAVAMLISDKTLGPFPVFSGLPLLFSAWAAWLLLARNASHRVWMFGLVALLFVSTGVFALFRMEGLDGTGRPDFKWRWSASPEEEYLALQSTPVERAEDKRTAVTLRPGDWPGFRGANRDSVVRTVLISTDWEKSPPPQKWRRPIGPGWSSMAVVDGRLFTQEQRGDNEAVVCLDADTGSQIWSHLEPGRFWDSLSSTGPRATPTFAGGRIYSQGATGTLVCLDAATGAKLWSRNVLSDATAKLPDWGVASSPLVTDGVVIVYAAGQGGKGLLAYRADSGELAWTVDAGEYSYSSPHLATIAGRQQVLFISDKGLTAVDPATGKSLWQYAAPGQPPRSLQPLLVGEAQLLVPLGMESPTDLIEITHSGDSYAATRKWTSRNLKPSFNDFVMHDGHVYGFDGKIFSCVELRTGERKWKKGRYGTGQVLLLADQPVLLVLSDQGQAVLVAANPGGFEEFGQFQALEGKTWNHPVIAHGRLYVRNAEEIACYELVPKPPSALAAR